MPKIIENIREKLLSEAKRQVLEEGYSALTIRSVASACSIGVGTVYNYFPSKDMLVASFMLEEWQLCLHKIESVSENSAEPEEVLKCIFLELREFAQKYQMLFRDENARESFAGAFQMRHKLLRSQLASPILRFCQSQTKVSQGFLADFVAESMLTWTMTACSYDDIKGVLLPLLKSDNET